MLLDTESNITFIPIISATPLAMPRIHYYPLSEIDSEHFHPVFEIGICMKGEGVTIVNGITQHFQEGDYYFVFPFQSHKNIALPGSDCIWKWTYLHFTDFVQASGIDTTVIHTLIESVSVYGIIKQQLDHDLCYYIHSLFEIIESNSTHCMEKIYLFMRLILLRLSELSPDSPLPTIKFSKNSEKVLQMLSTINTHLFKAHQVSVSELAESCNISLSTCRRVFTSILKIPPKKYISICAIKYAMHLLATTNMNIIDIASATGFAEISSFNRIFRNTIHCTPREYRGRSQQNLLSNRN